MDIRKTAKWLLIAVTFSAVLYGSIYIAISRSGAFAFAKERVQSSKAIENVVGKVLSVSLDPFGPFEYSFVNSEFSAKLQLHVVGSKGQTRLLVSMREDANVWQIREALIGDVAIAL